MLYQQATSLVLRVELSVEFIYYNGNSYTKLVRLWIAIGHWIDVTVTGTVVLFSFEKIWKKINKKINEDNKIVII